MMIDVIRSVSFLFDRNRKLARQKIILSPLTMSITRTAIIARQIDISLINKACLDPIFQ